MRALGLGSGALAFRQFRPWTCLRLRVYVGLREKVSVWCRWFKEGRGTLQLRDGSRSHVKVNDELWFCRWASERVHLVWKQTNAPTVLLMIAKGCTLET